MLALRTLNLLGKVSCLYDSMLLNLYSLTSALMIAWNWHFGIYHSTDAHYFALEHLSYLPTSTDIVLASAYFVPKLSLL
ncbi:hypothetical protein A3Q33_07865 [Colwellia sp. PAMC 21821]|nr:hypothetical protein A3Q33_07865 [Colwellia sp. PAMC 21821]